MSVGGQTTTALLCDPLPSPSCTHIGRCCIKEMPSPPFRVHRSHLARQQAGQFACAGGRLSRVCPLQEGDQPAQGASRLAHNPRRKGSYAPCALRCLDLNALMRNRREKNKAPVKSLSWGSACRCFQAGKVHLANPASQTPANPSCLANPSVGEQCGPPRASLCPAHVRQGKHSSLSEARCLQTVSPLFFNASQTKNTHITWASSKAKSSWGQIKFSWTASQLNSQWGYVQPAAA